MFFVRDTKAQGELFIYNMYKKVKERYFKGKISNFKLNVRYLFSISEGTL